MKTARNASAVIDNSIPPSDKNYVNYNLFTFLKKGVTSFLIKVFAVFKNIAAVNAINFHKIASFSKLIVLKGRMAIFTLLLVLGVGGNVWGQFAVTTNSGSGLAATYASLANAITALNAATINGPVVITCPTGTESAPAGGYNITATGTSVNTITIQGNGAANSIITAATGHTAGSYTDAVIKITGGDYITISGFRLQESANSTIAAATNNMTEFGIALFNATATNGAKNNTIQNNTISLGTTYPNTIGIYSNCTTTAATATTGTNSDNKVYGNTISNVQYGVYWLQPAATTSILESNNDIGGTSASTGNNITFGRANTAFTWTNPTSFSSAVQSAVYFRNTYPSNVSYNTINSPTTYTIANTGIFVNANASVHTSITYTCTISDNTITQYNTGTTGLIGIDFGLGRATGTIAASRNTITLNQTATAINSAAVTGIKANYASATNTCSSNTIVINQSNTTGALSSATTGITLAGAGTTLTASSNSVTFNQTGSGTATITGAVIGIDYSATATTVNSLSNTVLLNQTTSVASGISNAFTGLKETSNATTINIGGVGTGNTITVKQALTGSGTYGAGAITYIDLGAASQTTANVIGNTLNTTGSTVRSTGTLTGVLCGNGTIGLYNVKSNTATIDRVAASGSIFFTSASASGATPADTVSSNTITFTNLAGTTSATAISQLGGPSPGTGVSKRINNNTISISGTNTGTTIGIDMNYTLTAEGKGNTITISCAAPTVTGINTAGSATGVTCSGNTLSLSTSTTSNSLNLRGINILGGGAHSVTNNTFTQIQATGILATSLTPTAAGIAISGGTAANVFANHITNISVGAATSAATPIVDGIWISGGASVNVYKNKIQGISTLCTGTTGVVNGIRISAGTTNNVYNNIIGNLTASASRNPDAIRGISITSTTANTTRNIYNNSIYLSGSGGTNFGGSGVFHTSSATATTSALDLRNNLIVNNITASGTGKAVALRRSAADILNFASTSNYNLYYAPVIYNDGTNNYTSLATYKAGVARDANSFTESSFTASTYFASTTGSAATYLQPAANGCQSACGAADVLALFTDDYNAVSRSTNWDIGAWQFTNATSPPAITTQPSNVSIQGGNTATYTVVAAGTSLTYQWQYSASGTSGGAGAWRNVVTGTPTNITYADGTTATLSVTPSTAATAGTYYYRCIVSSSCGSIFTSSANLVLTQYCAAGGNITFTSGTTFVSFAGISNATPTKTAGYNDYYATQNGNAYVSSTYSMSIRNNSGGNYEVFTRVYIDWDRDGTFNTTTGSSGGSGETYILGSAVNVADGASSLSPLSIVVPSTASVGATRMRVVTMYGVNGNNPFVNASMCDNSGYDGEVEDYKITLSIMPKPVVAAQSSSTTYGTGTTYTIVATNSPTSYTASNLPTGITFSTSTGVFTVAATTAAGTYTIPITATNAGGTSTSVDLTYTVNAKALTVTASAQSKTYGGTAPTSGTLNTNYTVSGLVNSDAVSGVTLGYSGTPAGNLATGAAGSYTITPSAITFSTGIIGNYTLSYVTGTLTVNPANLTITANGATHSFGTTITSPGAGSAAFTSSGLVNSEVISSVTITYGSGASSTDAVGTYTGSVVASLPVGITVANYTISYVAGSITVTSASSPVCPLSNAVTPSADQEMCQSTAASQLTNAVTTSGTTGTPTYLYQWYYNTTNSNTIAGATSVGSATAATYTPLSTASEVGTRYYFCVAYATNNTCGQSNTTQSLASNAVKVTVYGPIAGNTSGSAVSICTSSSTTLTGGTVSAGSGSYTYLWESSANNSTWATAAGTSNGANYTTATLTANTYFRRTVSSGGCTDVATSILVTVNPVIAGNTSGSATAICTSTSTTLTGGTVSGGSGTYTYLWESSANNSTWATAAGTSTAANYTTATLTANTYFRRTVTSGGCTDVATSILVTVNPVIATNTVSSAQSICSGATPTALTGSTPTGGAGSAYVYLWESSTTSASAGFATASGTSNTISYTPGSLTADTWYRRTVTSGGCSDIATAIKITITAAVAGTKSVGNTVGADYATLTGVGGLFQAINACGLSANVTVNITSDITEDGSVALNQWTETGTGGYSLTINPSGGATRTLSGSVAGPLITLNGADRVTFNGLNTGSNALVISNTSTSTLASTIKLQADATNNTINNTSVLGSSTSATIGTIWFSTGTTTGNISNTISNCTISPAGSNLPYNAIYSLGTSLAIPNTVAVSNNNIADWNITVANSSGILVANTGNTAWNITGNKLYQTASRVGPSGTVYGINVLTGNGHTVNTNIVGYASSSATGALTITSGTAVRFVGINLDVLTSTASEVQGNTINGITMATTSSSITGNGIFTGIYIAGGKVNVGQTTGNTIGSTTSTGITTTASSGTNGILTNGIASASTSTVVIKNNTIAGISALGSANNKSTQLLGIFTEGAAGNYTINGNVIGSTSGPLNAGSASTTVPSYMCGIYNSATGTILIGANGEGNTVQYMNCNGTNVNSFLFPIYSSAVASSLNINYNSISNNAISSPGKANYYLYEGIVNTGAVTGTISISNNTIGAVTISGTSVVGEIAGINNAAGAATSTLAINSNSISGISISNTSSGGVDLICQTGTPLTETINNNSFNALSLKTTGTINFIFNDYSAPANGSKTIQGNSVGTSFTRNASGSLGYFYGYYDYGSSPSSVSHTISGNNFTNVNTGTSSSATYEICGIYSADYSSSNPSLTVYDNTISNWTISAGDGSFRGIYAAGFGGTSGSPNLVYGNTISNCTSASTALGQIGLAVGSVGLYVNVYENTISNNAINGAAAQFNGLYAYGTANTNKFYNNTITNLTSNTTAALIGLWIGSTGGPQIDVYQNKINTFSSAGNLYGVYVNGGTAVNVYNHSVSGANNYSIFGLTTSGATSIVEGIRIAGGTTINMYSNNIYNLSNSSSSTTATNSLVNGLSFTGGTTVNAYNNLVSKLTAPSVSYIDAVRGISVTSTTASTSYNIYNNTLFLDASSTGTNFGTSGIHHTANATATTAKLNLINNIVINTSTPRGTGVVTALRRSASATLGNFASTSNNNMYYAGTPSATKTIMYDGTNAYQTATTYLAAVSARETNSFSETFDYPTAGSFFISVTATDATYLKPGQCADTEADGGGVAIGSVTVDYSAVARATTPDIGAWEFSKLVPTITTTGTITAVCNSASVQTSSLDYTATTNSPTSYSIDWDATANTAGLADQSSTNLAFASGTGSVSTISITAATPAGTYNGVLSLENAYGCSKTQAVTIVVNPLPTATWAATATDACYSASAQTTTLAYTATTNTPTSYSISWNSSPTNSFVAVANQANTFTAAGGAGTITIDIPAGTAAGTYTGTITVKNANTCLSSAVQTFTIVVNPVTTASVSITADPVGTICAGTSVTFTAAPTNGGAAPAYQWKKNGVDISGETGSTYVTTSLANNDAITAVLTSNATPCLTSSPATSNTITGTVSSPALGTMTTYVGDYVWNGLVSTDFSNVNNWYQYSTTGAYTNAPSAPNSTIGIVIPVTGTCVINQPTISSGTVSVDSLTILSGATLTIGSGVTFNVGDNFTNNGTLVANSASTVNFIGSSNQSILGSSSSTFGNVTINKSSISNTVTMATDATLLGTLTLTSGKLIVDGGKTLFVGNTSTNGTITGGSSSSYIVAYDNGTTIGKVQRAINTVTSYAFPIGDLSNYAPVNYTLVSGALSSANLSVYTKPVRISAMNTGLQTFLNRYWEVTPTGISGSTYNISYNYADGDINSGGTEADLLPVKFSGGVWYRPTGSSFQTGVTQGTGSVTASSNLLTWSGLTTYSAFGGAGNEAVVLPVDLVLFTGSCVDRKNILKWETFTEMNNDYYTIENTIDGISFEEIGIVDGAGNSSEINAYEMVHQNYRNAINYYRLKQTDFDGSSKYSELISIDNRSGANEKEIVSITNLLGQEINEYYKGLVIVTFTDGTSVKRIQ